jgi:excisionase family DNA binding protein
MEQQIILLISLKEFEEFQKRLIREVLGEFEVSKSDQMKLSGELYTRKQLAEYLQISLPTLHTWTKEGRLKSYRIGNRVLYKKEEVNDSLK